MESNNGLYKKYQIFKDGEEDNSPAFVLKPVSDPAAREALFTYASLIGTENPQLEQDLINWVLAIEDRYGKYDWEKHLEQANKTSDDRNTIGEEWLKRS